MTAKPGVVLVHGAWHSSWHFETVTSELERKGYPVEAPTLPTVSLKAVEDSVPKSITVVKNAISNITSSGRDAVVICHSFGGIIGSEAVAEFEEERRADGASPEHGRIVHLLFVSAIIIGKGVVWAEESKTNHAIELKDGLLYHLEPIERFYNTMDPVLAQQCADKLLPLAANSGMTRMLHCGWADYGIPVTYIACERDMALKIDTDQSTFLKRLKDAGVKDLKVERIDCDHTPWLSSGQSEFYRILWDVLDRASSK